MSILIIDESKFIANILREIFLKYGEVDIIRDYEEAYDKVVSSYKYRDPYDLIIIDTLVSRYKGYEILKKIRSYEEQNRIRRRKSIILLYMEAYTEENMSTAYDYEVDGILAKPLDLEEIELFLKYTYLID